MDSSLGGCAINVINAQDHTFELNEEELKSVLLRDGIKDRNVVVVSVAGAFRKGKSFLLNFMIRYLESQSNAQWLGGDDIPLQGFSWRGGSERDTTGILFWNKVYIIPLPSGEEVAVILMDTQGAFDSTSTVKECATVFALSTMLSSIQVYNLSQNIQEDDLQHLQLFAEYGRLALEDTKESPFQRLIFLVRDWSYPYDAPYGEEGGQTILDRRLQISETQHPQLQQLRRHIKSCFSEVTCFLMPHPGLEVATNPAFDGRLSDIRAEFKENLEVLVPRLLSPENLLPKKIGGRCITVKELLNYFKSYTEVFKGDHLPEPKSMLEATAEANNLSAMANAKEYYVTVMENVCGGTCPYLRSEILEKRHLEVRDIATQKFLTTRRMGSEELSNQYLSKLEQELEDMFSSYARFNDSKQISSALRTPMALFMLITFTYVNAYLMTALGLPFISFFSSSIMGIAMLTLGVWAYSRYTGELQNISTYIDAVVAFIVINYVMPSQKSLLEMVGNSGKNDDNASVNATAGNATVISTKSQFQPSNNLRNRKS